MRIEGVLQGAGGPAGRGGGLLRAPGAGRVTVPPLPPCPAALPCRRSAAGPSLRLTLRRRGSQSWCRTTSASCTTCTARWGALRWAGRAWPERTVCKRGGLAVGGVACWHASPLTPPAAAGLAVRAAAPGSPAPPAAHTRRARPAPRLALPHNRSWRRRCRGCCRRTRPPSRTQWWPRSRPARPSGA